MNKRTKKLLEGLPVPRVLPSARGLPVEGKGGDWWEPQQPEVFPRHHSAPSDSECQHFRVPHPRASRRPVSCRAGGGTALYTSWKANVITQNALWCPGHADPIGVALGVWRSGEGKAAPGALGDRKEPDLQGLLHPDSLPPAPRNQCLTLGRACPLPVLQEHKVAWVNPPPPRTVAWWGAVVREKIRHSHPFSQTHPFTALSDKDTHPKPQPSP